MILMKKRRTIAYLTRRAEIYAAMLESAMQNFEIIESEFRGALESDDLEERLYAAQRIKIGLMKAFSAREQLEALLEELDSRKKGRLR
jgi:hypothetical protein